VGDDPSLLTSSSSKRESLVGLSDGSSKCGFLRLTKKEGVGVTFFSACDLLAMRRLSFEAGLYQPISLILLGE